MDTLAKPAIDAVRNGEVKFIPERFDKHILIGWKILEIGVYQDNCGGDIEYQHIIVKSVVICKFQKVKLQNVINVEAKI